MSHCWERMSDVGNGIQVAKPFTKEWFTCKRLGFFVMNLMVISIAVIVLPKMDECSGIPGLAVAAVTFCFIQIALALFEFLLVPDPKPESGAVSAISSFFGIAQLVAGTVVMAYVLPHFQDYKELGCDGAIFWCSAIVGLIFAVMWCVALLAAVLFMPFVCFIKSQGSKAGKIEAKENQNGNSGDMLCTMSFLKSETPSEKVTKLNTATVFLPMSISDMGFYTKEEVVIRNARHVPADQVPFLESGFTILTLPDELSEDMNDPSTKSWIEEQLESHLRPLGEVGPAIWTNTLERSMGKKKDAKAKMLLPAALGGPHLDYYQDMEKVADFSNDPSVKEIDIIVGVWKPFQMANPVRDVPLAVVDARTFSADDMIEQHLTFSEDQGKTVKHSLTAAIRFNKEQKWYYFDEMTTREVLLFTHYTNPSLVGNGVRCNPHGAFVRRALEGESPIQPRRSQENRISFKLSTSSMKNVV